MSMVHCRGCGQQIHETAVACPHCGAPQGNAPSSASTAVPQGVPGWSWAAFLFPIFWGIGNRVWISLLTLIPFIGVVMMIVLGIKGREWAWQAKRWDSVEHFQRVQRSWSAWSVGILLSLFVIGFVGAIAAAAYGDYVKRAKASEALLQQRDVETAAAAQLEASRAAAARLASQNAAQSAAQAAAVRSAQDSASQAAQDAARQAVLQFASQVAQESTAPQTSSSEQTSSPAPTTPASLSTTRPDTDLLAQARSCQTSEACTGIMLEGALPRRADVVQAAATTLGTLPRPSQGDRKIARDLNKRALEQFSSGNYSAAAPLLQQASSVDPSDVEIRSNLGLALVRSGNAREAEIALIGALEIDPRRTAAWVPLADALEAQSKSSNALRALLLAYEFSANKQRTLDYYRTRSDSPDLTQSQRGLFAKALVTVESGY